MIYLFSFGGAFAFTLLICNFMVNLSEQIESRATSCAVGRTLPALAAVGPAMTGWVSDDSDLIDSDGWTVTGSCWLNTGESSARAALCAFVCFQQLLICCKLSFRILVGSTNHCLNLNSVKVSSGGKYTIFGLHLAHHIISEFFALLEISTIKRQYSFNSWLLRWTYCITEIA